MDTKHLLISINANSSALNEEIEELTLNLLADLEAVGLRPTRPVGAVPSGAKAFDVASVSQLIIALVQSGGLLVTVVNIVRDWLGRQDIQSVVLEAKGYRIELKNASPDEQRQLIEAWIDAVQRDAIN